ncbi:hypothetical protein, partial [Burkholderia thailandensis]|uniref:hypothetical protein n=1 Tax=Burkholderia thailandensis TaxID=57975 RepID=UPI003F68AFBB
DRTRGLRDERQRVALGVHAGRHARGRGEPRSFTSRGDASTRTGGARCRTLTLACRDRRAARVSAMASDWCWSPVEQLATVR